MILTERPGLLNERIDHERAGSERTSDVLIREMLKT